MPSDLALKTMNRVHRTMMTPARIVSGEERARLWEQITSDYRNYADYQSKTDREIPVVVLDPV